jgi:hypothetical protein
LIHENLMRISPAHDHQLQTLIEHTLLHISEEPITGLKKLLEIYLELLRQNNGQVPAELRGNLSAWQSSHSLHRVLQSILQKN